MQALQYLGTRLFGSGNSAPTPTLDEFKITCYRHPRSALAMIEQYPHLAKNAPFDLLVALACARTPLAETLIYQDPAPTAEDILIALIDAGAKVDGIDPLTGHTLLHMALENDLEKAALKLVGRGLDCKPLASTGITALHLAARDGYRFREVIEMLIQNNAALKASVTNERSSPLHFAAQAKSLDGVHLLLKAGVDATSQNSCLQTALDVAKLVPNNLPVVNRLQAPKGKETESFLAGCLCRPAKLLLSGNYERALYQIKQGDTIADDEFCLLWISQHPYIHRLLKDYPQIAKQLSPSLLASLLKVSPGEATHFLCIKLINLGIEITGIDQATGKNALHFAVQQLGDTLVTRLLEENANPSAKDKAGNTPLHYSAEADGYYIGKKHEKILEALLNAGSNPMLVNNKGQLPFYVAQSDDWKLIYTKHALASPHLQGNHEKIIHSLIEELKYPSIVQAGCTPDKTPLEAILLLDLQAGPVLQHMQDVQILHGVELLLKKYPGAHELILIKFFDTDTTHINIPTVLHTNPPKTAKKQNRNELLTQLQALPKTANSEKIENEVSDFLAKVKKREAFSGTPKAGTVALNDFYRIIRNALNNLVLHLNARSFLSTHTITDIAKKLSEASGLCGMSYFTTALDLYNTYCLNITPSLKTAFLEQLQVLRGVVLQKMLSEPYVRQGQSTHALSYFKRTLGQELQLADRASFVLEDVYEKSGFVYNTFPDHAKVRKAFNSRYTTTAIYDWMYHLMADDRYRNFYIDWAKVNLNDSIPPGTELHNFLFVGESFEPNHIAIIRTLIKLNAIKFKNK